MSMNEITLKWQSMPSEEALIGCLDKIWIAAKKASGIKVTRKIMSHFVPVGEKLFREIEVEDIIIADENSQARMRIPGFLPGEISFFGQEKVVMDGETTVRGDGIFAAICLVLLKYSQSLMGEEVLALEEKVDQATRLIAVIASEEMGAGELVDNIDQLTVEILEVFVRLGVDFVPFGSEFAVSLDSIPETVGGFSMTDLWEIERGEYYVVPVSRSTQAVLCLLEREMAAKITQA